MRTIFLILLFVFSTLTYSQEELANDYFSKGQFNKALTLYKTLEQENKRNTNFKLKIVEIYRKIGSAMKPKLKTGLRVC